MSPALHGEASKAEDTGRSSTEGRLSCLGLVQHAPPVPCRFRSIHRRGVRLPRDLVELAALKWSLMGENLYENRLVWRGAIDIGTSPAVEALHQPKPIRPGELAPLRFAARANRSDVPRQDGTGSHEPSSSSCSPIRCDWPGRRRSGRAAHRPRHRAQLRSVRRVPSR